ncbi:MAG: UDP-N-acetylmuramoyl-L-alanyl-D-glutamate--2,6-diaminopimelate ligase [Bacilli bacterium]|nr:UDP-N-acetylmuramoyl-L-alanyl-D-glutamate--2,6-diaminopimelate ligase [Bacilli bacterium]
MINIKADSRKVKPGDTFVALRGISSDGHEYIDKAISLGATKLVVMDEGNYSIPYEIVKDTREYLNNYLKENYNKYLEEMTIIGFTGTNGKTTSAFLLQDALNKLGIKCGYIGTIGYYLGEKVSDLPNTSPDVCDMYELLINAYDNGYKFMAIEASSQGLDMGRLDNIPFDYAVFTNLTQDHLDYHKTMENYALAKTSLFKKLKPNGVAMLNYDDEYNKYYISNNTKYYGFKGGDYKVSNVEYSNLGTKFELNGTTYNSPLLGDYNVYNLASVIAILREMNIKQEDIMNVTKNLSHPAGRMDLVVYNDNSILIDYAHTPDAIEKVIDTVKKVCKNNIYVVFGCTGSRDKTKRPIMTNIVLSNVKKAVITMDDPHDEDPMMVIEDMLEGNKLDNYEVIINRKEAIRKGVSYLEHNDILLVLGKGHESVIIIGKEKIPFNDKEAVLEIIGEQ